jgi:hypothetical protein
MTKFTKEQLITQAREEVAFWRERDELIPSQQTAIRLRLAEITLAALTAEPVGEVALGEYDGCGCHPDARVVCIAADGQADWENFRDGTRLYTAPAATVSVPDLDTLRLAFEAVERESDHGFNPHKYGIGYADQATQARWESWLACRAAMLQGAEPVREWIPCSDRLPPEGYEPDGGAVCYLVWHKDEVDCGPQYGISNVFFLRKHWEKNYTHWMPLPAAPQSEVK